MNPLHQRTDAPPAVASRPPFALVMAHSALCAFAVVSVGLGLVAMDPAIIARFHATVPDGGVLRTIAQGLTRAIDIPSVAALGIIYLALCRHQRFRRFGIYAIVMLTQGVLNSQLKDLFGRSRPDAGAQAGQFLGPIWGGEGLSFPGGHASAAFALAVLFSAWHPRLKPLWYGLAVAVALARVYLNRHYIADVYFGAWIGGLVAASYLRWLWHPPADGPTGTPPPHQP